MSFSEDDINSIIEQVDCSNQQAFFSLTIKKGNVNDATCYIVDFREKSRNQQINKSTNQQINKSTNRFRNYPKFPIIKK